LLVFARYDARLEQCRDLKPLEKDASDVSGADTNAYLVVRIVFSRVRREPILTRNNCNVIIQNEEFGMQPLDDERVGFTLQPSPRHL
jgi:hypothetical protein